LYIYSAIPLMRYPLKNLLIIACFLPLQLLAQNIAGIWVGYIHNDSTNLNLYYEVVVTQHKGKLSGYSYTNFIVDGKELTGVKTIKISSRGEKIYFEDDDLIYNDYPFAAPKGVRQLSVYELKGEDMMEGKFITSRTKQYGRPVTGTITLQRVKFFEAAKIYPVLKQMNLLAGLSFINPPPDIAQTEVPKKDEPVTETPIPKTETAKETPVKTAPVKEAPVTKSKPVKEAPVVTTQKKVKEQPPQKPVPVTVQPAAVPDIKKELAKRKVEPIQTVFFTSDSLVLELYDNGYVDGDSVSIIINGKELLTHVRLTEKAVKKTIYITRELGDSINLVMFAENLGSIAPNSGLAIIRDGNRQHRITFSGDLEKNAAIILRRRK
jgi:hypothetical protein